MKILVIFGTRPEAIKCFPVVKMLKQRPDIEVITCLTAQHRQLLDQVLQLVGLQPEYDLDLMRKRPSLTDITCDVLRGVGEVMDKEQPDRVLVQGDTTTTMAAALAAYYRKIPVGHIEAGLRSHNRYAPWPEEINRKIVSTIADQHFAPTSLAQEHLLAENVPQSEISVTGNTVIDALHGMSGQLEKKQPETLALARVFHQVEQNNQRLILVTSHRRENWGDGLHRICDALTQLSARGDVHFVYPLHPNPNVAKVVKKRLGKNPHVSLIEPLDYLPFIQLMSRAFLILTDSGGVQEEAPALGKPVLVLRDSTERTEAITSGNALLVGTNTELIVTQTEKLLDDPAHYTRMSQAQNPFGDGTAAQKIADYVLKSEYA